VKPVLQSSVEVAGTRSWRRPGTKGIPKEVLSQRKCLWWSRHWWKGRLDSRRATWGRGVGQGRLAAPAAGWGGVPRISVGGWEAGGAAQRSWKAWDLVMASVNE